MNEPFHHPNTFLLLLGYAKAYFRLPHRQAEGTAKGHAHGKAPSIPDYSTISRRTNRLGIKTEDDGSRNKPEGEHPVTAMDSTCIRVTNRGQWMKEKWNAGKNGYLKMHISVNAVNKKILSMRVTDEHAHDGKASPELVYGITRPGRKTTVCKLFADGAYGSNDVFRCLSDNGIHPCVKARRDARVRVKTGHILRLETCQFYRKEMILEIGKTAQAMESDGWRKQCFCPSRERLILNMCLFSKV